MLKSQIYTFRHTITKKQLELFTTLASVIILGGLFEGSLKKLETLGIPFLMPFLIRMYYH